MRDKILIIGGNGYIGSSLYEKCKLEGYEVDSIDLCLFGLDLEYSSKINYNNVCEFTLQQYKYIVLLAAHSSVAMAEFNPQNAWNNNVNYFHNLCSKLDNDQVLIYASSASVYGNKPKYMCSEDDTNLTPVNHYDLTKITDDIIANKFIAEGKQIIGLRFGTLNGYSFNIRSDLMINMMYHNAIIENTGVINVKNPMIHRAILGINDCVGGILAIIKSDKIVTGQFNLVSFNDTVGDIARQVATYLNVDRKAWPDDPESNRYDSQLFSYKFLNSYDYSFKDTVYSIVDGLKSAMRYQFSRRGDDRLFNRHIQKL